MENILIYGAYGYTGRLIIQEALKYKLDITIGGRNKAKIEALSEEYKLKAHCFNLDDQETLLKVLENVSLVIHCAGPFQFTAKTMIEACITTKTHYMDITGEFQVFELAQEYNEKAMEAGIMLLPGAGFDVVPSDCLAANLKASVPDASHLELAFTTKGGARLSRGTAKTMVEGSSQGQVYRENGKLTEKPMGKSFKTVNFGDFEQVSVGISWGDISSAYFSTQIPNIEVYTGSTPEQIKMFRMMGRLKFLLKSKALKNWIKKRIDAKPAGPSDQSRDKSSTYLWGRADGQSAFKELRLKTPNGYTLTALIAVLFSRKILEGKFKTGYQTPSTAFGKDVIFEVEGCEWIS